MPFGDWRRCAGGSWLGVALGVCAAALFAAPALAQKPGGVLHLFDRDSPADLAERLRSSVGGVGGDLSPERFLELIAALRRIRT